MSSDRAPAPSEGFTEIRTDELERLRMRAALVPILESDFVSDGEGDVHGPHLAEPEVWERLRELEGDPDV